jgi:hypothetical protein
LFQTIVDADAQAIEQVAQQECANQAEHRAGKQIRPALAEDFVNDQLSELRIGERKSQ